MSSEDIVGLLMGIGLLVAVIGYLSDIYRHPQRFNWLEPKDERGTIPESGPVHRDAA
ncbi:MAG TPA: hypothetical protein VL974_11040 [Magnetospirillum sp.]|jgi:hypothetical protein|nr:hypothetical protein [Magnetospirillum sp.]